MASYSSPLRGRYFRATWASSQTRR